MTGLGKTIIHVLDLYNNKFQTFELRLNVPILILFFLYSLVALSASPLGLLPNTPDKLIIVVAFIPASFFGILLAFIWHNAEQISKFLRPKRIFLNSSDNIRKFKYTNGLISLMFLITAFSFFETGFWWLQKNQWASDGLRLSLLCILLLFTLSLVFFFHINFPSSFPRVIFISVCILVFGLIDTVENTIQGRSLFLLTFPILLSSFLISPSASITTSLVTIVLLAIRSSVAGIGINIIAYLGLLFFAILIWIISDGWSQSLTVIQQQNKNLEKLVRDRTIQLSKANSYKSNFLAQIAHELQSPIIAFSLFIRKISPFLDENEYVAITNETYRILEMTKSISAVAKMELDILENKSVSNKVNLFGILDKAVEIQRLIASDIEKSIELATNDKLLLIYGNRDFLYRIFQNIIGNSIKYSYHQTTISVKAIKSKNKIIISISDHGIGIPKTELPYVFDRFKRASNVGPAPGSGLGLALVREMVEAMRGKIDIDSTLGKGTTVTLTFPRADPHDPAQPSSKQQQQ